MRLSNRHNNDPDGFEVSIEDFCKCYGVDTYDLALYFTMHRPHKGDKKNDPGPLTERRMNDHKILVQNQVDQCISLPGTPYIVKFEQLGKIPIANLILEECVKKKADCPHRHGKHYRG